MSGSVRGASPAADRDAADAAPWIVDESAVSSWHLSYDPRGGLSADAEPLSNAIR